MQSDAHLTPSGLSRRIKQHVTSQVQHFFAVCTPGLEEQTQAEIADLPGVLAADIVEGGVEFSGPFELVYVSNLLLRTSNRVLMRIDHFVTRSYPELFDKVSRIPWERFVGFGPGIVVDVTAKRSRIHHEKNIAASVFDAIQRKMSPMGVKLRSRIDAQLCVFIRLSHDECTVSIDSSGQGLHKRGYREAIGPAPLRETTAAALLRAASFQQCAVIADPCCGSGTFLIEAGQMAKGISAGAGRQFAFEAWPSFGEATWKHLKQKHAAERVESTVPKLVGMDINAATLRAAQDNAVRAGLPDQLVLKKAECRTFNADGSVGPKGLLISNLPYGKRMEAGPAIEQFYKEFGSMVRGNCKGWRFGILVPDHAGLIAALGLTIGKSIRFLNGGIAVRFVMGKAG